MRFITVREGQQTTPDKCHIAVEKLKHGQRMVNAGGRYNPMEMSILKAD